MPTKFAIVGVQRTGTTWIRTTLNNHPSILALGEVFLYSKGRFPFRQRAGADVEMSYRDFVERSAIQRIRHLLDRSGSVRAYLEEIYSQPGFDAIGFKLMRTQCRQFPAVARFLVDNHLPVIHVIRRNVLKTLVSRETARQRQLFHTRDKVSVTRISLDTRTLVSTLDSITRDNDDWQRILRKTLCLQIYYESFVSTRDEELRKIYEFLSVQPVEGVSSNLVKINPESICDVVNNFQAVHETLRATPYAWCLAE